MVLAYYELEGDLRIFSPTTEAVDLMDSVTQPELMGGIGTWSRPQIRHQRNEQAQPVPEHSLNGGKKEQHILKMASLQLSNRTTPMMHLNLHAHHSPMQILLHLELDAVIPKLFYHIQKIDPLSKNLMEDFHKLPSIRHPVVNCFLLSGYR